MPEFTDKPGFAFGDKAPPEVLGYIKNKGILSSWSWLDVEPEEHAVAFAVAKATNAHVLTAIKSELERAIDEGVPFEAFKRTLEPRLKELGWWGVKRRYDPEQGERFVRLGSPRRLKVIYDANIRSARAAGEWERIQRTRDGLPYLLYELGPSEVHRPGHVAKEGIILPVDDPFWLTWFPPNGWGCKCRVRQITEREAIRRGGVTERPKEVLRDWTNKRTGEVKQVPVGIDPGWEHNPGVLRRRHMERYLANTLEATAPDIARTITRDMIDSWRFRRVQDGTAPGSVPVAMLPAEFAQALGTKSAAVRFSDWTANKQRARHPRLGASDYHRVQAMLNDPSVAAIRNEDGQSHKQISLVQMAPATLENGKQISGWAAVLRYYTGEDALFLQSIYYSDREKTLRNLMDRGQRIR